MQPVEETHRGGRCVERVQGVENVVRSKDISGGAHNKSKKLIQEAYVALSTVCKDAPIPDHKKKPHKDVIVPRPNPYAKSDPMQHRLDGDSGPRICKKTKFSTFWETDDEWEGGRMKRKNSNATRLWLQNPNGVSARDDFRIFRSELSEFNENDIDFLALPEATLNSNNHFVRERLTTVVEYQHPNAKMCITNTSGYCKDACYQPGGVISIAMNKLAGRYAGKGSDSLGRYTWMRFKGKLRTIKIYTFYRVSQNSGTNLGDTTAFVQQYNKLNTINNDEAPPIKGEHNVKKHKIVNPRKNIVEALMKDVHADIKNKELIILMGDLNEDVYQAEFGKKLESIGIINAHPYSDGKKYRSYNRGKSIIDGIWLSGPLLSLVQKGGLAPFQFIMDSDHRGIYVDIDMKQILDSPPIEFTQMNFRRLQASIPKRTKAYCDNVKAQWSLRGLHEKIQKLNTDAPIMCKELLHSMLNNIDLQISQVLAGSEKRCTNANKTAIHEWSPKLGIAIVAERNCKKRISKLKRVTLQSNYAEISKELLFEENELKKIRKEIKHIKKNDVDFRRAHIDELILEKIEKSPGSSYAGELKKLQHIEKQRKEASLIRNTKAIRRNQGISKILIPAQTEYILPGVDHMDINVIWERMRAKNGKDVKKWIEIEDRDMIEKLTLDCMRKHFGQAGGTPLTNTYWSNQLVNDSFIENMRNENYECLENETIAVQEYFQAMKQPREVKHLEAFCYTFEQWEQHIDRVKEKTTTSPSGRHYGHFKTLKDKEPEIFRDIYAVMNIAFREGILLDRWKKTVTVLIPKDEGTPKIHRLRPLHIVEPEVNALAKALWAQKLMYIAEKTHNMSDDQYGGRKNRQAQSAVLNKILYYDINRATMVDATYDDIDMKSNYDRELARLVAAEARIKLGLHKKDANFMIDFVEAQQFYVKTAYGVSEKFYKYEEHNKLFGLGQGIAWSGPGWLISSDTIAKCKKKSCVGMIYKSPISKLIVKKQQDKFVDDTGCGCNNKSKECVSIMDQTKHNCQKHSDYVETTGGMVAADKSHYYQIQWEIRNGMQVEKRDTCNQSKICLKQCDGVVREFRKMQSYEEHKTLGCWVNPLGIQNKAYIQIQNFMRSWANRMRHSTLPAKLIRKSYESELLSQIRYRLPVYIFSKKQCDKLMKIVNPILLHSQFMNKNYPRTLVYANDQHGGLNMTHIYDIMGIEKIKFFFMHLRKQDTTAKLLLISMQTTQLECGSSKLFFNLPYKTFSSLATKTWCKSLWEFCDTKELEFDIALNVIAPLQRKNDRFIMDVLVQDGRFSTKELFGINKYRQHLKLLMLSDVTDLRGKRLLQDIKDGKCTRPSKYEFCRQQPIKAWETLWITRVCPILNLALQKRPLGIWVHESHQVWKWEYAEAENKYLKCDNRVYVKRNMKFVLMERGAMDANVEFSRWADVGRDRKGNPMIVATVEKKNLKTPHVDTTAKSSAFRKYESMWGNIEYMGDKEEIRRYCAKKKCLVATDGANRDEEGAQAWIIATDEGVPIIRGRGRVNYAKDDASSLRPELAALLAVTTFISVMAEEKGLDFGLKGDIPIYTDSSNAISDMQKTLMPSTKNALENNIDMKLELKHVLRTSKVKFKLIHVRAHQDEKMPFEELTIDAKLNCLADKYAGGVYTDMRCGKHMDDVPFLDAQICSLRLPLSRPVTNVVPQVITFSFGYEVETQLARFWKIKHEWMCNVEWRAFRVALKRMRGEHKGNFCKIVHKQIPTMQIMKRNGFSTSSMCPMCLNVEENWQHVFQCKSATAMVAKESQMIILKKSLTRVRTHPVLQQRIFSMLRQWMNGFSVTVPGNDGDMTMLNEAFRDQGNLLYENLFAGVISHKFGEVQRKYYQEIPSDRKRLTQNEWNVNFVRALLTFSANLWKTRCEYLQTQSELSTEQQVRTLALQLRTTLRENPWKVGIEDTHLFKRNGDFFRKANVRNLNGWIERVLVSMNIQARNEDATRQDIKKWIQLPADGYHKKVTCGPPTIIKSYKQLTFKESCANVRLCQMQPAHDQLRVGSEQPLCQSGEQCSATTMTWEKIEYDLIRDDEENVQLSVETAMYKPSHISQQSKVVISNMEYVQQSRQAGEGRNFSVPMKPMGKIKNWFVRKLGLHKCKEVEKNSATTEEIIFGEASVEDEMSCVNWNTVPDTSIHEYQVNEEQHNQNELLSQPKNIDEISSYESIGETNDASSMGSSDNANEDTFAKYFMERATGTRGRLWNILNLSHNTGYNSGSVSDKGKNQFILSSESISEGSVAFPDDLPIVVQEPPFIDLPYKHGRSKQLQQMLEDMESSCGSVDSCGEYEMEMCEIVEIETSPQVIHENCNADSSIIRPKQKEEVETFRGSSGSRVVKQANGFFHQVRVVDEASLQKCANAQDEKKRNRDPTTSCKQLQHISNALPQVKSQQKRSQRILKTGANRVNSTIKAMTQQESDSRSDVKRQTLRQNLSFQSTQSRNNVMLNHKSYLRKLRACTTINCQNMDRSHVICSQSFMKFSLSGERGKLPNELRMTSVEKDQNCRVTGLKYGTELANEKFIEGKKEVGPSTYPTGCPNNYFDCLNKTNKKS